MDIPSISLMFLRKSLLTCSPLGWFFAIAAWRTVVILGLCFTITREISFISLLWWAPLPSSFIFFCFWFFPLAYSWVWVEHTFWWLPEKECKAEKNSPHPAHLKWVLPPSHLMDSVWVQNSTLKLFYIRILKALPQCLLASAAVVEKCNVLMSLDSLYKLVSLSFSSLTTSFTGSFFEPSVLKFHRNGHQCESVLIHCLGI